MNFRSTSEFKPPFYLQTSVEEMTPFKVLSPVCLLTLCQCIYVSIVCLQVEVLVKLKADFPAVSYPTVGSSV